jgi:hypothetical protein
MNKLDEIMNEISNMEIPEDRVEQAADRVRANLFGHMSAAPGRIRNCSDFQALIPAYLNKALSAGRTLLLQDHTRECVACRHAVQQARSGVAATLIRPSTAPTRTVPKAWPIAAMVAAAVGLGAWFIPSTFGPASGGHIAVQTVSGTLYAVSDRESTPIFSGKEIGEGQRIRTAKDSTAVVRLADGSLVEMNARSEISVARASSGTAIHLDRGEIIVQAAKQRTGTLNVLTPDCAVSVKGTIFAVARGVKGSRVSVVEGSVKVDQGSQSQMLKPGDQVTTDAALARTSVQDEVAWSRNSARYLAVLGEFSAIGKGLTAMPSPTLRYESKLLNDVPEDTVLYAAIPNLGPVLGEADRLFQARLQQSEVLRSWWEEQQDGPKLQEMLQKLRSMSEYLGEEIVLAVAGDWRGNYRAPIILAEVRRPGLDSFLNAEFSRLSTPGGKRPKIMAIPSYQAGDGPAPAMFTRTDRPGKRKKAEDDSSMVIGLSDKLVAITWSEEQLADLGQRIATPQSPRPERRGLLEDVAKAYNGGVNWLLCVNMEQIARNSVRTGRGRGDASKLPPGLESVRNLMLERKDVAGVSENQATLTFSGRRSGVAAWLAEPSPMGSLEFVSPNATFAVSLALRSPQSMLADIFRYLAEQDPQFQEHLDQFNRENGGLSLSPSLGEPLGGEITFAVDGPVLPLPSWKLIAEVYSPDRLQWTIEQFIAAFNRDPKCPDCRIDLSKEQTGNRTFYTLTTSKFSYEIDYVFVDGYVIAAPSRALLTKAIQNRESGLVLSRSESFRSQLPRDGRLNFSAIVYHNLGTALSPLAQQLGSSAAVTPAQRESIRTLAANTSAGLIYAYGEPDRITVASSGSFFGFDLNSFALPALIANGSGKRLGSPTKK